MQKKTTKNQINARQIGLALVVVCVSLVCFFMTPKKDLADYCAGGWLDATKNSFQERNTNLECLHIQNKMFYITSNGQLVYKSHKIIPIIRFRTALWKMEKELLKYQPSELTDADLLPITGSIPEKLNIYDYSSVGKPTLKYQLSVDMLSEDVQSAVSVNINELKQIARNEYH